MALAITMLTAWFALSNHCVLGAVRVDSAAAPNECPMHNKSSEKVPAKQNDAGLPCCKILRAVTVAKTKATPNTLDFVLKPFLSGETLSAIPQPPRFLFALDTGPPGALSFSEIVLQRSILAHAPPRLV